MGGFLIIDILWLESKKIVSLPASLLRGILDCPLSPSSDLNPAAGPVCPNPTPQASSFSNLFRSMLQAWGKFPRTELKTGIGVQEVYEVKTLRQHRRQDWSDTGAHLGSLVAEATASPMGSSWMNFNLPRQKNSSTLQSACHIGTLAVISEELGHESW